MSPRRAGNRWDMSDPTQHDQDPNEAEDDFQRKQGLLDRFRNTGVGVEDPNIVGDTDPTDVAPGSDPDPDASGQPPGRQADTPPPGA